MPTPHIATLKDRRIVADQTLEFVLQRPSGFEFQAGQNVNLKLSELAFEDARHGRRSLTIASPPYKTDLWFTTRLTGSGFKKTVLEGPIQDVEITGPLGNMLHDVSSPAIFIAGGIGITPFKSMILEAIEKTNVAQMSLFYSNKTLAATAFHSLFTQLAEENSDFKYIPTLTSERVDSGWQGERARIDAALLHKYVDDFSRAKFYVCGSPKMTQAIIEMLKNENVTAENILSESFWGYNS